MRNQLEASVGAACHRSGLASSGQERLLAPLLPESLRLGSAAVDGAPAVSGLHLPRRALSPAAGAERGPARRPVGAGAGLEGKSDDTDAISALVLLGLCRRGLRRRRRTPGFPFIRKSSGRAGGRRR